MEDLTPVLALFRLVLVKPPRGGWDKARARAAFTMQSIGLFERRDFASLLPAACAHHHLKHNKQARVVGRAEELVCKGSFAKACGVLLSPGPMEEAEDMLQVMLEKHPPGGPVAVDVTLPEPLFASEGTVMKQLWGFARGTLFGSLGAKDSHLLNIIDTDPIALKALTALVNCFLAG